MNKYAQHQLFLKKTILDLQKSFPSLRVFARHVGVFYTPNGTPIKINQAGMFDAWGFLRCKNMTLHLEFEFKTGLSKLSKQQKTWASFLETQGVNFFVINENNLIETKMRIKSLLDAH